MYVISVLKYKLRTSSPAILRSFALLAYTHENDVRPVVNAAHNLETSFWGETCPSLIVARSIDIVPEISVAELTSRCIQCIPIRSLSNVRTDIVGDKNCIRTLCRPAERRVSMMA